jgi:isopenicillin N synthase-like dioxygenase
VLIDKLADGQWSPVAVTPPTTETDPSPPILINIGDLLSHWTNGLFRSTVHRVIFPKEARRGGEDRYSIAFFCHPFNGTLLEQVPSELVLAKKAESGVKEGAGEENAMTAEEHLHQRLKATYLALQWDKKDNEVQTK